MATVQKTFSFATNEEGLVDQASSAIVFAYEGTDGNPAGCVKFTQGTKNATQSEVAMQSAGGQTWETWGVPAGATVNTVRVVSALRKVAANTKLTSHSLIVNVVGTDGISVGPAALVDDALPTAVGGWLAAGGIRAAQTVDAADSASNAGVRFRLDYSVTTSAGSGSASVDARVDQIVLEIDYTASIPPVTGSFTANANISQRITGSFTANAVVRATVSASFIADAIIRRTETGSFVADAMVRRTELASFVADAIVSVIVAGSFIADAEIGAFVPTGASWVAPPADAEQVTDTTPTLNFNMPDGTTGDMYFEIQLDTVNTFNSANLRVYRSYPDATGWEYFNGVSWVVMPAGGVPAVQAGQPARFTVPTELTSTTWYRRVRSGA